MTPIDGVVELRRYTLHPGARETLIELFEEELVIPQEEAGMRVIGQFRDLDEPDHFVWLRGFRDMDARDRGLRAFYGGPVWERHKAAANATMIDSDDVLLLRPARPPLALAMDPSGPDNGATGEPGFFLITVYSLNADASCDFLAFYANEVAPVLRSAGADIRGVYRGEPSANTFPMLPVREGEDVVVSICSFSDEADHAAYEHRLAQDRDWRGGIGSALSGRLAGAHHAARLVPTERSRLRR